MNISGLIVSLAYVAAQIFADIGSLKILSIAGFSIDGGTFIYPLTFTLRDMVHKVAGIKTARILILCAAGLNLIMALFFKLIAILPADLSVGPQTEFAAVLAPVWRIVFASILAEAFSEFVDTEVYQLWVKKVTTRFQWLRVLTSNSVSVPLDSSIFSWVAFGGVLPSFVVWSIVLSNIIVKGATTVVSLPWIYLVKDKNTH